MSGNAIETLREYATFAASGVDRRQKDVRDALAAVEALLEAAKAHTERPFGQLNARDFYRLREQIRRVESGQ